jgi:hypothetical protein
MKCFSPGISLPIGDIDLFYVNLPLDDGVMSIYPFLFTWLGVRALDPFLFILIYPTYINCPFGSFISYDTIGDLLSFLFGPINELYALF